MPSNRCGVSLALNFSRRKYQSYLVRSDTFLGRNMASVPAFPLQEIKFGPKILLSPDQIFFESSLSYGVVNLKPIVPGHVLIISKRVCARYSDLTVEEVRDLSECVRIIVPNLEQHFGCTASNIAIQDGKDSGQSVAHVHIHILPRRRGDFERNDEVHERIDALDSDNRPPRSAVEMASESFVLRGLFSADYQPKTTAAVAEKS